MTSINAWVENLFNLVWSVVLVGRFDEEFSKGLFSIKGEQAVYWLGAATLFFGAVFLWFFVRENKPRIPAPVAGPGGFKAVMRNLFKSGALWPVYFLVFSHTLLTVGLGAVNPLLVTEQWSYSKQDLGTNIFVGGVINMFFIPVLGIFANRIGSLRLFSVGMIGVISTKIAFYIFVQFILPDHRPTILHMILFGQVMSMFGQCTSIATPPLIFDYIPRDQMGTAQAGLNFVRSITRLLTLNGVGLWVTWYSAWFCPPGVYDYFSGYLFMILMNLIGVAILVNFLLRVRRGQIKPVGREGFETDTLP